MSEWISVKERLPEDDVTVWVFKPGESSWIDMAIWDGDEWIHNVTGYRISAPLTHWREIEYPEPPKESE